VGLNSFALVKQARVTEIQGTATIPGVVRFVGAPFGNVCPGIFKVLLPALKVLQVVANQDKGVIVTGIRQSRRIIILVTRV
jgi:hypothetical protein